MDQSLTFSVRDEGPLKIVQASGLLGVDEPGTAQYIQGVTDLMEKPGARIVLDLSGVSYVNSAGLGSLVRVVAQGNLQEARVVIAGATPMVAQVLELTKLNRFFEVCPDLAEARRRLA